MYKDYEGSLYGTYRQQKFTDIYPDVSKFLEDYTDNGIPVTISDIDARTLYFLLYAQYGNSTIANADTNQFKYKLFGTIYMYGPTWEKRLQVQESIRALTEEDITTGNREMYNHANNPATSIVEDPDLYEGTLAEKELNYVNDQNVTHMKKGKLEGYSALLDLLETDVTKSFIDKFKPLFLIFVEPEDNLYYETEE